MNYKEIAVKIGADLSEFDRGIQTVNSRVDTLNRDIGKSVGAISESLRNAGIAASVGITAPLALAARSAFNATLRFDAMGKQMETIAGSAAKAEKQMGRLYEVAKAPGLGFEEAVKGSAQLQAIGLSAKDAEKALEGLGKAIARAGGGRVELAGAMKQVTDILSRGTLEMQDTKILATYIPELNKVLRQIYGTSNIEALRKQGVDGLQMLQDVTSAFSKMKAPTDTLANAVENLNTAVDGAFASMGKSIEPILKPTLKTATLLAEEFTKLPSPIRATFVAMATGAAMIGPALLVLSNVGNVIVGVKSGLDLLSRSYALKAANAVASGAATVRAEATVATAVNAEAVAVGNATRAWAALAAARGSAQLALPAAGGVAGGAAAAGVSAATIGIAVGAAITGGVLIGLARKEGIKAKKATDELNKGAPQELELFKRAYYQHSDQQLQNDLEQMKMRLLESEQAVQKYEMNPFLDTGGKAAYNLAKYQQSTDEARVKALEDEIKRRERLENNKGADEEQKILALELASLKLKLDGKYSDAAKTQIEAEKLRELERIRQDEVATGKENPVAREIAKQNAALKLNDLEAEISRQRQSELQAIKQMEADRARANQDHLIAAKREAEAAYQAEMANLEELASKGEEVEQRRLAAKERLSQAISTAYREEQRQLRALATDISTMQGSLLAATQRFNGEHYKADVTDATNRYLAEYEALEERKRNLPERLHSKLDPQYATLKGQYALDVQKARREEANRQAALRREGLIAASAANVAELRLTGKDFEARKLEILDARDAELSEIARRRANKEALPEGIEDSIRRKADASIKEAELAEQARRAALDNQELNSREAVLIRQLRLEHNQLRADQKQAALEYANELHRMAELDRQHIDTTRLRKDAYDQLNMSLKEANKAEAKRQNSEWREEYGMWLNAFTGDLKNRGGKLQAALAEVNGRYALELNKLGDMDLTDEQKARRAAYAKYQRDVDARSILQSEQQRLKDSIQMTSLEQFTKDIVLAGFQARYPGDQPASASDIEQILQNIIGGLREDQRNQHRDSIDQLKKISGEKLVGSY